MKNVFKFLKDNSFLISLSSAILCGLAYLYQVLELRKWNIPLGIVDGMRIQYLLIIIISILYCFSSAYLHEYIITNFNRHIATYMTSKFIQKNLKKLNTIPAIKLNTKIAKRIEHADQLCNNSKRNIVRTIVSTIIMGYICFLPFYILFYTLVLNSNIPIVLGLYNFTIAIVIIFAFLFSRKPIRTIIRQKEKDINRTPNSAGAILSACEEIINFESSRLEKIDNFKKRNKHMINFSAMPIA